MILVIKDAGFGKKEVKIDNVDAYVLLTDDGIPILLASNLDGRVFVKNATEDEFQSCLNAIGFEEV